MHRVPLKLWVLVFEWFEVWGFGLFVLVLDCLVFIIILWGLGYMGDI
jgi:hypothetical protein